MNRELSCAGEDISPTTCHGYSNATTSDFAPIGPFSIHFLKTINDFGSGNKEVRICQNGSSAPGARIGTFSIHFLKKISDFEPRSCGCKLTFDFTHLV